MADSELWKLSQECRQDSFRWFPDMKHTLANDALCLAGEAGEVCNVVKKIERGTMKSPREDAIVKHELAMEMADVLTYLLKMAGGLGIDLQKAYEMKRTFNQKRFGAKSA